MKLAKILSNICFYFWFTITSAQSLSLPLDSILQPNFFIQHSPSLVPNCSAGSGINFGNYVNCQLCQLFEELNSHWEIFYRVTASQSFYNFSSQWSWAGWALLHWQNIWNDAPWRCVHNNIFGHLIIFFPRTQATDWPQSTVWTWCRMTGTSSLSWLSSVSPPSAPPAARRRGTK